MMLHQDASSHEWVADEIWDLVVTLDDATSEVYSGFFVEEEGTMSTFRAISEVIAAKGLFCSLYADRAALLETFDLEVLHGAVKDALRLGAIKATTPSNTLCCAVSSDLPAQTRPGYLSLPASGQRGDHGRRQLYELVGWRRVMTDTPQVLLAHHLKTLKLPDVPAASYDKLARQCATEGADYVRYLVRLTELELIDRERRMVERRIRQARFPAVKSLDSFDFKAIASLNKMLVLEFGAMRIRRAS